MLDGSANLADGKFKMTEAYRAMGYDSERGGFPQDPAGTVPPARRGGLTDLASEKRMTLTITTNYRMAANAAWTTRGTADDMKRWQFPCWELVRIGRRRTPRGFRSSKGGALEPVAGDDWPARWVAAGGTLYEKGRRMIAPKDSPVWQALGDGAGGHKDTLGNPYPPFAFGSGYGLREVAREDAPALGVINPDDMIAKVPPKMAEALQVDGKGLDPALLKATAKELEMARDGQLTLSERTRQEAQAAAEAYRAQREARRKARLGNRLLALLNSKRSKAKKVIGSRDRTKMGPKEWKEEEWVRSSGRFAGRTEALRVDSIRDFLFKMKGDPQAELRAHVMMLDDARVTRRVSKAFGKDMRGWEVVLDSKDYRHAQANHETEVGAKWGELASIITRAEHIIPSKEKTKSGETAIEVWKNDGTWLKLVLVEGTDQKVKVKTFKRRRELFNRRGLRWRLLNSLCLASKRGSDVRNGSGANRQSGELCAEAPSPHVQDVHQPHRYPATLRARCKHLLDLLTSAAA